MIAPSALDLTQVLRPGDAVLVAQGTGEPQFLTEALVAQRAALHGTSVFGGISFTESFRPEHADHLRLVAMGGYGTNARLARAGVLQVLPCHVGSLPQLIDSGALPVDAVFVQLAPRNNNGYHSLGLVADYLLPAIRRARVVIAEVNAAVPWTLGDTQVDPADIDIAVESTRPLIEVPPTPLSDVDRALAGHAVELIPDGATLQFGIGKAPEAIADALAGHHDLGLHSGVIFDRLLDLVEGGVVTNQRKEIDRGVSVTGALFGTQRLYRFAHQNTQLSMRRLEHTHHPAVIAQLRNFVSVQGAIEVDLSGNANSEVAAGVNVGAVGGAVEFTRGAALAPGGRSIIGLASTARRGTVTRIVPRVETVTIPRSDTDLVVTEFGVAALRGCSLPERARGLIAIAHPDFREQLQGAARDLR